MKKVAVILSGCGVMDGTEINEAVFTLLALDKANASVQCFAPNIPQYHVINHRDQTVVEDQTRNVLEESARISRGAIEDLAHADPNAFDAVIVPGGFGAAKNLCNFAQAGEECQLNPQVLAFCHAMAQAGKAAGFICIAPVMIPKLYPQNTQLTIGDDPEVVTKIERMGGQHIPCTVDHIVIDEARKVVSTPAYMKAQRLSEAAQGIERLVQKVLALA